MGLADWIMRTATDDPPHGRERWAQAMRAEYASLDHGKLNWALGCWATMLGWRLRADAFYLVVMITVILVWAFGDVTQSFAVFVSEIVPYVAIRNEFIHPYLAVMLLVSIALSAFRPDRVVITAITMLAIFQVSTVASLVELQRTFPEQNIVWPIHPFNAQYFVAVFAEIGVCFVGALVGRGIARLWRRDRRKRWFQATAGLT